VAKTDGVPLFVEELTKAVLESGLLRNSGDHYELAGPLPPLAIPANLHDSLMARLDRLAPVKEIAQIGAVIGREFSYQLLAALSPLPEDRLRESLDRLVASELVFRRGSPPDTNYTFKHALVRDAAYQSLLKSTRQRFHQKIARTLEEQFPATAETQPELLAYHYTEAQLTDQAIDYWQRAGQRASKRSATVEAIAHLSNALDLLESLPPSIERDRKELRLRIDLTSPLIASKGMASPEMGQTTTRARALCERLGETTQLFPVLYGQWVFHHVGGQVAKGLEYAKEAAQLAEGESSEIPRMVAYRTLGIALVVLGEPAAARRHLEQGNPLYDAHRHRDLALVYGMDFCEVNLAYLALTDWFLGFPNRALKANEETIRFARFLSHASSLCHALANAGVLHTFNRQFASAQAIGEELMRVAGKHQMPQWSLWARMFVSIGLLEAEPEEGTRTLEACLETCRAVPILVNSTLALARLAESQARHGEYDNALRSLEEADGIIKAGGERWARSEIVRLKGEISRARFSSAEAEACFRRAIDVAQRQGAKLLQLRAATSLARFWQNQGRFREARELLAPLYQWFTEGFETQDLKDARALLEELR
jgi:predicted ATPase